MSFWSSDSMGTVGETPGAFIGGLRVMAVDGTGLDVPDSQAIGFDN